MRPSPLALAAAAALAAAPTAGAATVASGPLRATAGDTRWALSFAQRDGSAPAEAPALALGFRTATGWARATTITASRRDGRALVLDVATDDVLGRGLHVRIAPARGGVIAVRSAVTGATAGVTATRIGFAAPPGERLYGLGERSTAVDQRGRDVENYVADGPYPKEYRAFILASGSVPPAAFRDRDDATYYPVPWLLSSRGYGFLLDRDETSTFRLATEAKDAWSVEVEGTRMDFRVFAGPTPAGALRRFTAATGRQPPPAAAWQFGPWFQTGQPNVVPLADEAAWLKLLRDADAPVSAAETQLRYLPCGLDRGNEDYEAQRVALFHDRGLAILTYVNPMVCASYGEVYGPALSAGALQRDTAGAPAAFNSFVGGTGPAGFTVQPVTLFDFTTPTASGVYASVLRRMLDAGHDGWMEDFGEATPPDTRPRDGTTPAEIHNRYPTDYHCAVYDLLAGGLSPRPIVRFQRSGWTGSARCASDVWGGDPTTTFGFDGLRSAIKQALSIGLSGVSRWGSDIGGYDTLPGDPELTPELLRRWIELGAVSGVMRTKKSGIALPPYERPQIWEPGNVEVWRRYAKLHTQLYPYLLAADATYRRTGMPLMRALVLGWPSDERAQAVEDEFGFGPDLLAAPVVVDGARSRRVYLPRARWIDVNRAIRYRERDGSLHLTGRGPLLRGPAVLPKAPAPLDVLPLYARSGSVLPLLAPDVDTLSDYSGDGVVGLRDRLDRLRLLAFPDGRRTSRAFEDEAFVSRASARAWTLRIVSRRARRYRLEADTRRLRFRPCRVTVAGRPLGRGRWSLRRGVLRARFTARRGPLRVTPC